MSPEKLADKLGQITDEIACVQRLVDVGWLATSSLRETEREALSELLTLVAMRLGDVVVELGEIAERQAA